MKLTTATPARSKSSRLARAIVWFASSASAATFTLVRCIAPPRWLRLRSTRPRARRRGRPPPRRPRRPGTGTVAAPTPPASWPSSGSGAGSHSCPQASQRIRASISSSSSAGAGAGGVAGDDLEVEVERLGHHLAQRPDPDVDLRHPAAVGVAEGGVDDRAGDRELVHVTRRTAALGAQLLDGLEHQLRGALDRGRRPRARARAPSPRPRWARRRRPRPSPASPRPS